MDPITTAAGAAKLAGLVKKASDLIPRDKKRLDEEWDRQIEEVALEANAAIKRLEEHLDEEVMERVVERMETREGQAFARVLYDAAVHAVTTERVRMLCAALAGGLAMDEAAEMKSRVARAVVALEPSDVTELRRLDNCLATSRAAAIWQQVPRVAFSALTQTGCIYTNGHDDGAEAHLIRVMFRITAVGKAVLAFLANWTEGDEMPGAKKKKALSTR